MPRARVARDHERRLRNSARRPLEARGPVAAARDEQGVAAPRTIPARGLEGTSRSRCAAERHRFAASNRSRTKKNRSSSSTTGRFTTTGIAPRSGATRPRVSYTERHRGRPVGVRGTRRRRVVAPERHVRVCAVRCAARSGVDCPRSRRDQTAVLRLSRGHAHFCVRVGRRVEVRSRARRAQPFGDGSVFLVPLRPESGHDLSRRAKAHAGPQARVSARRPAGRAVLELGNRTGPEMDGAGGG